MGKSDKRNILLFVFMVLGFLLALQFRSVMSNTSKDAVSTAQTIESLKKELEREKTIGEILKKELEESIVEREIQYLEI